MFNNCMLTTVDNPFDPFEEFTSWMLFDTEKGYNSSSYLMRIAKITDDLSEKEKNEEIERAIDEILRNDIFNIYKKVSKVIKDEEDKEKST